MVLASDGLWEFIENEEVVQFLGPFYEKGELKKGCKALLQLAEESWTRNSTVRDDITIIIVKLKH
jgi:serine/threonine protein phosphatase PrpC